MRSRRFAGPLSLGVVTVALAACGGGNSTDPTDEATGTSGKAGNGSAIRFEPDPGGSFTYTTKEATVAAGTVTIDFTNPSAAAHDVRIEDSGGADVGGVDVITEGSDSSTVNLRPGDYTFYCSLEGHRLAGMEGTLKVRRAHPPKNVR